MGINNLRMEEKVMKLQNDEPVSVNIEVPAHRLRNVEQIQKIKHAEI